MSNKHNLELNKLASAILFAGITAMVCGFIADGFYQPKNAAKRGFHVDVVEDNGSGEAAAEKPLTDAGTLLAHADAAKGNDIVQKSCSSCHSFNQGGANGTGPNLYGVVGGKIAHKDDFAYSDAVKSHGGTWGYDELNHWLYAPSKFIKGTRMGFAGLKKDEDRGNVIAYLKSISPSAPAIPAPSPEAAAQPKAAGGDAKPTDSKTSPDANKAAPAVKDTGTNPKAAEASKDVKNPKANLERKSGEAERQPKNSTEQSTDNQSKKAAVDDQDIPEDEAE